MEEFEAILALFKRIGMNRLFITNCKGNHYSLIAYFATEDRAAEVAGIIGAEKMFTKDIFWWKDTDSGCIRIGAVDYDD